jgi:hypothetical protein
MMPQNAQKTASTSGYTLRRCHVNGMRTLHIMTLVSNVTLVGCTVFGIRSGTEQPPYTIEDHIGSIEIRSYEHRVAAQTTVKADEIDARSIGFRKLASYIFGNNIGRQGEPVTTPASQQSQQVAMTAPVAQSAAGEQEWTIRFFLPSTMSTTSAPVPVDHAIQIIDIPAATMAVKRFSGIPGKDAVAAARNELLERLRGSQWHATGAPVSWFYDPPWTIPPLRRNEIAVPVTHSP